ncbi:MAG: serine protease [Alphaproteobacteria bacterium]|nr:serine protease [Alphaproteobacteria bacterium]
MYAQEGEMVYVNSGTGFFVSNSGHVITNHHVVEGCKEVVLQGAVPRSMGKVVAVDKDYDLALIKAKDRPRRIATIRHPDASKLRMNEPLLVMGYPLDSFKTAQYQIEEARIVGLKGPTEEPHWIQFSDSAQHGNSGGPLLDSSGNVAGVVVGKSQLVQERGRNGRPEVIQRSDVAISLPILMRFLDRHYIAYRFNGSYSFRLSKQVEDMAKGYIVNVLCYQGEMPA